MLGKKNPAISWVLFIDILARYIYIKYKVLLMIDLIEKRDTKRLIENYLYLTDNKCDKKFYLSDNQREIVDNLDCNSHNIIFKNRQTGISSLLCAWAVMQALCSDKDSPEHIVIISHSWLSTNLLQEQIVKFIQMIPNSVWRVPVNEKLFKICNKQKIELFNGVVFTFMTNGSNNVIGMKQPTIIINDIAMIMCCKYNGDESVFNTLMRSSVSRGKIKTVFVVESENGYYKPKISIATEKIQ